ncbi:ribonuclease H-like domain, reverse transcriptase, RNA-dependent DNA polymerase [Tanacetum coccineum]
MCSDTNSYAAGRAEDPALLNWFNLCKALQVVKKLEKTVKQLRETRLVVDASAAEGDVDIQDDIDLDGLSRMASTALGHDQPAVPSEMRRTSKRRETHEKDPLLSAQYKPFREPTSLPLLTSSKRQKGERVSSQPASVPAATTLPADDPDSAGGGSSNHAAIDSAGSTARLEFHRCADSAAGPHLSSHPCRWTFTVPISTDQIPMLSCLKSPSGGDGVVYSESESDDDMEHYIPPLPYGEFKDWEILLPHVYREDLLLLRRRMNRLTVPPLIIVGMLMLLGISFRRPGWLKASIMSVCICSLLLAPARTNGFQLTMANNQKESGSPIANGLRLEAAVLLKLLPSIDSLLHQVSCCFI